MTTEDLRAGTNIAIKIPPARFEATVAFYRDALGFELTEEDVSAVATLSRSFSLPFGPVTLWLDRVEGLTETQVWFELVTDDLPSSHAQLTAAGALPCDEVEPFPDIGGSAHWVRDPAGTVHLLRTEPPPPGSNRSPRTTPGHATVSRDTCHRCLGT